MSIDEWIKIWNINTMRYSTLRKEENPVIFYNAGERWGHNAKWGKPITKRQTCMIAFTLGI